MLRAAHTTSAIPAKASTSRALRPLRVRTSGDAGLHPEGCTNPPCGLAQRQPGIKLRAATPALIRPLGTMPRILLSAPARGLRGIGVLLLAASLFSAPPLHAQSLLRGELAGTVRAQDGRLLTDAAVSVTGTAGGTAMWVETNRDGAFQLPLLRAGEYDVRVEAVGFVPRLYRGVDVPAGQATRLSVELERAAGIVEFVDTVFVGGRGAPRFDGTSGRRVSRSEIMAFPDRRLGSGGVGTLGSILDASLGSEGLPGSMTSVYLDGLPFTAARHPLQRGEDLPLPFLPRLGLGSLDVHRDGDVEWGGAAGSYVAATSRSGAREARAELFGSATTEALWHAGPFSELVQPEMNSGWGGGAADVPLANGSSQLFLGVEGMRSLTPSLSPLSGSLAGRLIESRPPADGADAHELSRPWVDNLETVSGLARLDWSVADATEIMARTTFSTLRNQGGRYFARPLEYGVNIPVDGTDVTAAASVLTQVHPRVSLEIRAGFERSVREWLGTAGGGAAPTVPSTRFMESGALLGADPGLAGRVSRTGFLGGPTAHLRWQDHWVKAGVNVSVPSYEYEHIHRSGGEFLFGSPERVASGEGLFLQTSGSAPTRSFTVPELGLFFQHRWEPTPEIRLTTGLRFDREGLPTSRVPPNQRWAELTGIQNTAFASSLTKVSPRLGVTWDLAGDGRTILEGGLSTHFDRIDPGAINEVLSLSGSIRQRRQIGGLDDWPELPDPNIGDADPGIVLALFGPELSAPRTARASVGLSQRVGDGTVLHLTGTFRRTEFLLRRADLNRTLEPSGTTADGRLIYGELRKVGSVVTAEPGSNRRFSEFDAVWALNSDGWSDHRGMTFSVEQAATRYVDLFASYTFSSTEDNLVGARAGIPEAGLRPNLGGGTSREWQEGVSDFDAPHRLTAGFQLHLPVLSGADFSGIYRLSSGMPFTPGYRAGTDVNGDGSGHNDPAFVTEVGLGEWDCLNLDLGQVARRNGCRASASQFLDLHLSVNLFRIGTSAASLTLDAFNILDAEMGTPDNALFLVDDEAPLELDPDTGQTIIPFQPNPAFGEVLNPLRAGRMIRIGFRVALP